MVFSRKPEPKTTSGSAMDPRLDMARQPISQPQSQVQGYPNDVSAPTEHESIIGNDLSIEGQSITIRCKGSLRVNGNIQADLHSRKLVVGDEAVISGSIAADNIAVYGRVNGAIYGAQVTLHETAQVEGDIHSRSLSIENGATFDGRSRKVANIAEIAPQLEAGAPTQRGATASSAAISQDAASTRGNSTVYAPPSGPRLHA